MKHIKTFLALLCTAVLALVALLAACGDSGAGGATVQESGEKLLVIRATETEGSLADALAALKEAGELTYEGTQTEYGLSLTAINGYTADAAQHEYWAQYTSLSAAGGVTYSSTEYGSYTYEGQELGYSSYGPSGMPLVKGEIYVFVIETW